MHNFEYHNRRTACSCIFLLPWLLFICRFELVLVLFLCNIQIQASLKAQLLDRVVQSSIKLTQEEVEFRFEFSLRGRPYKWREVKISAGGRRNGLQGRYCFHCFFRPSEERKKPDWSYLINYLIHPSDWSATCHSKPQRSSHIYIQQGR